MKKSQYKLSLKTNILEIELLLTCARSKITPQVKDRIRELVKQELNWIYLINIARFNKLIPLLYWNLNSICPDLVPKEKLEYLKNHFQASSKSNLYLTKELVHLLSVFETNSITAIPYKGPVLTYYLHNNLALREFSDLDILVAKKDVLKTKELLIKEGFNPVYELTSNMEALFIKNDYAYEFIREEDGLALEVHWRTAQKYFTPSIDFNFFIKSQEKTMLGNKEVLTLSKEELLLTLCLQGAKDSWETISLIKDVSELINSQNSINWKLILEKVNKFNCKRMIFLGLFLAHDLLDANIPEIILKEINNDPTIKKLATYVYSNIFNFITDPPLLKNIKDFQLKSRESILNKLNYLICFAFTPSLNDLLSIELPTSFSFLYYCVRPYRLLGKYAFGLFGKKMLSKYIPTPQEIVNSFFELANVNSNDIIYDLGCGDGRVVITAAKKYGARAIGIDIDPYYIDKARANAKAEGVSELVTFIEKDVLEVDLSNATVVTFYLMETIQDKLKYKLQNELKAGSRIISQCSSMNDWESDIVKLIPDEAGFIHTVRLWEIKPTVQSENKIKELASAPK